jgi:hypothetical protein
MTTRTTFIRDNAFWVRRQCPEEEAVRPYPKGPTRLASPQASRPHTGAVSRSLSDFLDPSMSRAGPHPCTIASDQSP